MIVPIQIDKTGVPLATQIPPQARELIEALLQKDPSMRPSIDEVLNYELFSYANPCRYRS